ncbi:hypothetical protein MKEN_00228000 [Mycena kentingensis (nom. inval.)]|nr:hypothetical protein MKEN_00228000 [Mycena kentingensis (nom. inval.)]
MSWFKSPPPAAISGPPILPEDLERHILLIAGGDNRANLNALMSVAKRARLWIEPLRYRIWVLYFQDVEHAKRLLHNKPDSVWRDGPRHVFLSNGDELQDADFVEGLLHKCTGIRNLSLYAPSDQPERVLAALDGLRDLRELSTDLAGYFGGSLGAVDLARPAFERLTHLSLMDELEGCAEDDGAHLAQQLALLPVLTHIALVDDLPAHLANAILTSKRDGLRVLVNLRQDTWRWPVRVMYERTFGDVTDARFVIAQLGMWIQRWEDVARGEAIGFWKQAETFVEKKRRGEIPADVYWTEKDMTV